MNTLVRPNRTRRLALTRSTPSRLAATNIDKAAVCMVAISDPKRELRTPDIVKRSKRSAGSLHHVEQERHRGVDAAEHAQGAGGTEAEPLAERQVHVREPRPERHKGQRQDLAGMREVEQQRHHHADGPVGLVLGLPLLHQQLLVGLGDHRQHDEVVAGGKRREHRRLEGADELPGTARG